MHQFIKQTKHQHYITHDRLLTKGDKSSTESLEREDLKHLQRVPRHAIGKLSHTQKGDIEQYSNKLKGYVPGRVF